MNPKSEQILPCPFCGGDPVIQRPSQKSCVIKCTTCGVRFIGRFLRIDYEILLSVMIKKWNRRVK